MKPVTALLLVFAGFIVLDGCVLPPRSSAPGHPGIPPVPAAATDREASAAWSRISADIRALERRRAPRSEWQAAAQFEELIRTRNDLDHVLRGMQLDGGLTEAEAVGLFQSGALAAHYGFPANMHALVFFDRAGRAQRVMSP
jgi:hypothetical protein